ncbi:plasmid replication protein [Bacillus sp. AR18-7]|nr:plasmid replication protein [Bacillus sp. AR18-7]
MTQMKMNEILNGDKVKVSLKFGYLGLGMGGCNIAAECAKIKTKATNLRYPYSALLINTNTMDLEKIDTKDANIQKIVLDGYEKGAGRDIKIGELAFKDNLSLIKDKIETFFEDRDFLWIVVGLGGGTGTGAILEALKLLYTSKFKGRFGLICTLPRENEGSTVLENALIRLQKIYLAMTQLEISMIPVINQKLYGTYLKNNPSATIEEYLKFSNTFIANTLHDMNVLSSSYKPYGEFHFDSSEWLKLIKTPGVINFAKIAVKPNNLDLDNEGSFMTPLKESITQGILSDGYDYKHTKRAAVSVITNQNTADRFYTVKFTNSIEQYLGDIAPLATERPLSTYVSNDVQGFNMYALFAGLRLPKHVTEMIAKQTELQEKRKEIAAEEDDIFAKLQNTSFETASQKQDVDLDQLFGSSSEDAKTDEKDPLAFLD